ncbi:protein of unknown function DUF218 [Methylophaga frappieri]|uniref:DUF218 domain-containing protein n=1 Tax=Methylophaga frappieri (strain ATCC BAA-2434 / DSM 25690 / JAM7) TaxID=754477 RepID=I1YFS3_METFJ|nr:YdcF family protein [Methylophaga frappieri]AFJ01766.1 protein of unknown function DUF218 [Methylophaga frappieri]
MQADFFTLSKIGWMLVSPTAWIVWGVVLATIFLLVGWIRTAKVGLCGLSLLLVLTSFYPWGDMLLGKLENRFAAPALTEQIPDALIVLGGAEDMTVSLSHSGAEVGEAAERYLVAAQLARTFPETPVWVSGGSAALTMTDHAQVAAIHRRVMQVAGLPAEQVRIEQQSRNTAENMQNLSQVLPRDGYYLLITSAFHMPRAIGAARQQGLKLTPYPVDYRTESGAYRKLRFQPLSNWKNLELACREWLGLVVYYLTGKSPSIFPAPGNDADAKGDMR